MKSRIKLRLKKKKKKKSHSKENKMSFIYYVLVLMLTYTGPVYAEIGVAPNKTEIERNEVYAQNNIVVGELPSGKIRIYTDRSHTTTVELDKQDCSIMRKEDDTLALGWKFGGLMWGFGPEIKIGHSSGVAWKHDVQRMVAEYQELCTQFNTGRLSQQEYQAEKQQIVQRGYNYARELEKRFREKKDNMFREMDQGRFISLQNARFYEGCCVTNGLPVSNHEKERKMLAEREKQLREKELALREKQLVEREKQVVAQAQQVRKRVQIRPVQRQRSYGRNDCRSVGVCNRSYNFNAVVPNKYYRHPRPRDGWDVSFDVFMKGGW